MSTNKKKSHSQRSQFIRSLAVCSVVLGLGAGYVANPIQAKSSPVKVRTNRQMKKGVTVRTTGKNAVYNKAGVLNSAKVVVNKKRTGAMGKSKRSGHYFRAYRVAKLSNGAVYYKVISFDGKYRGWVYGGRSINKINGGLKSVKTTKAVKAPSKNNIYQFKAGQSVWKHPERSVYKNGKVLGNTTKYTKHELKVTKAVRLTREGTLYYYVKNQTQPKLSGWMKASGLKLVSRGSAEVDKTPEVIETLPNLPGMDGNGNDSSGGSGGIITPEPELPGTTDPIKPGESNESGDGSGTEETPDSGDNGGESETDGPENGSEETPDSGDNGGEGETDEPEHGSEETPDSGDNSGETEPDGPEDGSEETSDPGNGVENETDGPEAGTEETPNPGDGSEVTEMATLKVDLRYTLNKDPNDIGTKHHLNNLIAVFEPDVSWSIPVGTLYYLANQTFPGNSPIEYRIYDSNGSVMNGDSD